MCVPVRVGWLVSVVVSIESIACSNIVCIAVSWAFCAGGGGGGGGVLCSIFIYIVVWNMVSWN